MQRLKDGQNAENKILWCLRYKQNDYYHLPWDPGDTREKKIVELEDGRASVKSCLLDVM